MFEKRKPLVEIDNQDIEAPRKVQKRGSTSLEVASFSDLLESCKIATPDDEEGTFGCEDLSNIQLLSKNYIANHLEECTLINNEMCEFLSSEVIFEKALLPLCRPQSSFSFHHMTLIGLLLGVPTLQADVVDLMVTKVPMFDLQGDEGVGVIKLILQHFKWFTPPHLLFQTTRDLLECLQVASPPTQIEIIATLPEITPLPLHQEVVEVFLPLILGNEDLLLHILDVVPSLSLPPSSTDNLVNTCVNLLDIADETSLPLLTRFLIDSSSSSTILSTFSSLRTRLSTPSLYPSITSILIDQFSSYFRSNEFLAKAFLKFMEDVRRKKMKSIMSNHHHPSSTSNSFSFLTMGLSSPTSSTTSSSFFGFLIFDHL